VIIPSPIFAQLKNNIEIYYIIVAVRKINNKGGVIPMATAERPRFNDKGMEVVSAFVFYGETGQYKAVVERVDNPDPNSVKKVSFSPSKDFSFCATKDKDCNIDIYLHVNPKHLASSIPKIVGMTHKAAKILG
jgi:hypothetical protein